MTKLLFLLTVVTFMSKRSESQLYFTKNGSISFLSKAVLEDIKADNNQVISVLNIQTGRIQFSLFNDAFHFPKAKMEDDFKHDYIESDKYPQSTFKGNITEISNINFTKDGTYEVLAKGDLMIHGVTKNITTPATLTIKNGDISAHAAFKILLKDYKISIPSIVSNKVAEEIGVNINCHYERK